MGIGNYVVGIVLVLFGVLMALPVLVNFPDSWFGAVIAAGMMASGAYLIWRGSMQAKNKD